MKIREWQLDTRQGPPFSWEVLSSQLVLFHCTSILAFFPPPSSGSLPRLHPWLLTVQILLSYSYGKVYFVFTTAESARAATGMELGLPLGSTSKGQGPSLKQYSCNLFRNQKSSQYLRDILLPTIFYLQVLVLVMSWDCEEPATIGWFLLVLPVLLSDYSRVSQSFFPPSSSQ